MDSQQIEINLPPKRQRRRRQSISTAAKPRIKLRRIEVLIVSEDGEELSLHLDADFGALGRAVNDWQRYR